MQIGCKEAKEESGEVGVLSIVHAIYVHVLLPQQRVSEGFYTGEWHDHKAFFPPIWCMQHLITIEIGNEVEHLVIYVPFI